MPSFLRRSVHQRVGRRIIAAIVVASAVLVMTAGGGQADAATFKRIMVGGCGMPASPVDIWSRPGNYKTVIVLDGLRATDDMSGWRHSTKIQRMASSGVNVVEPVGGLASFYTDWDQRPGNRITYRYRWTCRLGQIVKALDARRLAVGRWGKYAMMGTSMGGGSAMIYGAYHRSRISHVFSMSGYVNLSAPTMREAVRLALLDAGIESGVGPFSADAMWGPPWAPRWEANDPLIQLSRMRGMKIRVAAGSGTWGQYNHDPINAIKGTPLELVALAQSRNFEVAAGLQGIPITTDFPPVGTHTWGYWEDMVFRAKNAGWFHDR
ncbi:MAG: alpha/beta hydrolase family protein [Gordonia sp. (in: high G+C Gram-positive bacteria)]